MTDATALKAFDGSCHCEAVRFTVKCDPSYSAQCDCSMCKRRNSIMLRCDESDFAITAGQDALTEYRFNTGVAIHYFCSICGCYTFHRMRKLPEKYAINAGCLDSLDVAALRPIFIEGSKN